MDTSKLSGAVGPTAHDPDLSAIQVKVVTGQTALFQFDFQFVYDTFSLLNKASLGNMVSAPARSMYSSGI